MCVWIHEWLNVWSVLRSSWLNKTLYKYKSFTRNWLECCICHQGWLNNPDDNNPILNVDHSLLLTFQYSHCKGMPWTKTASDHLHYFFFSSFNFRLLVLSLYHYGKCWNQEYNPAAMSERNIILHTHQCLKFIHFIFHISHLPNRSDRTDGLHFILLFLYFSLALYSSFF